MADCQGPPTATQSQTTTVTSTVEQVITTTELTTVTVPVRHRRQDSSIDNSSSSAPSATTSSTTTSSDSLTATGNEITSVITNVRTFTETSLIIQTSVFPTLTLFGPCSSTSSSTSSTSTSGTSSSSTSSRPRTTDSSTSTSVSVGDGNGLASDPSEDNGNNNTGIHTTVQGGLTVVVSKFVTEVGGSQTTVETPIQTLLNTVNPLSPSERGGIIAGGIIGGLIIVVGLLTLIFCLRRLRQNKKRQMVARQKRMATPRHLLEDEAEFDLAAPMRQWDDGRSTPSTLASSVPKLLRPRGSSTGSLFRENVWPPPQEAFRDPLVAPHDDLGSTVSLVMGPPPPDSPTSPTSHRSSNDGTPTAVTTVAAVGAGKRRIRAYDDRSISSASNYSYDNQQGDIGHSREASTDPLLSSAISPQSPTVAMRGYRPNPAYVTKMQEASSTRSKNYRPSGLSETFTPPPSAFSPSTHSRPTSHRRGYSAADMYAETSPDSESSELLRAVLNAGSTADLTSASRGAPAGNNAVVSAPSNSAAPTPLPDELPPLYDSIPRGTSE